MVPSHSSQRGFALITVLLVAALVAILSSELIHRQQQQIQRSGYMLHQTQALSVAWGLESWVKEGLKLDGENNKTDHLGEQWAQPMLPIPFEEGEISGQLFDNQAQINVNNLLSKDEAQLKLWQGIVKRYVQQLNLNTPLADLITDWIDQDSEPTLEGAESDQYLLESPAYSVANVPMTTAQEVLNLKGIKQLDYAQRMQLLSGLTTLPMATAININTASKQVLLSLSDWMTVQVVDTWIQERILKPAESIAQFQEFLVQATGLTQEEVAKAVPDTVISVNSDFFTLQGRVDFGLAQQLISGLFYRDQKNQVWLLQRWLSVPE